MVVTWVYSLWVAYLLSIHTSENLALLFILCSEQVKRLMLDI
jgi:hypothetical protein